VAPPPSPGPPNALARSAPLRFEAFDGLRAIAATLVIAYHVALAEGLSRTGLLAPLASELKGGVTVFFVISGFLLYVPYARALRDGEPLPDWRSYARRRVMRIIPGYWVALTILGAISFLGLASLVGPVFTAGWWRYYGLSQIYSQHSLIGGLGVAWSLCVEATFYLVLPFFARWMGSIVRRDAPSHAAKSQLAVVGAIGLCALLLRAAMCHSLLAPVPGPGVVLETALPGALDWFAIGIALAVIAVTWETAPDRFRPVRWLAGHAGLAWLLAALLYAAGALEQRGDLLLPLYGVSTHLALGLAGGLLVLPAIARRAQSRPVRFLSAPVMAWVGTVSYGVYLWHIALLRVLNGPALAPANHPGGIGQALVLFLATTAGAIALGAASWYLVERPAQRFVARRRRSGPPRPAVDAVSA
jgi:peptidoglycan/LPS O-acetylase OafA/YrhL